MTQRNARYEFAKTGETNLRRTANRETLKQFTERAISATVDGTLIPPTVYIPVNLRRRGVARVPETVTLNPKTDAEIDNQIALADPVGFLVAIMQGQPIPCFEVGKTNDVLEVRLELRAPDLKLRSDVAIELMRLKRRAASNGDIVEKKNYERMIEEAANGVD